MIVQNIGHGGETDLSFTIPRVELAKAKRILEPIVARPRVPRADDGLVGRQGLDRRAPGIQNAPGYAARMFGTLADAGVNIEMISTSEIRITAIIAEDALETAVQGAPRGVRARAARFGGHRRRRRRRGEPVTLATIRPRPRREQFDRVGSTNDVVRGWLAAGEPEVCLAVAGEQTAGRGRNGRTWSAPPGAALLLSLGFRPAWLAPDRVWRLAAIDEPRDGRGRRASGRAEPRHDPPEVAERPRRRAATMARRAQAGGRPRRDAKASGRRTSGPSSGSA